MKGEIRLTERGGHAHELALEAAASGADLVMAWGGDGTINEVGRALVQDDAGVLAPALGIIPGGSGNGLARDLGVPFDPAKAIEHAYARRLAPLMWVSSAITCSSMSPASDWMRTWRRWSVRAFTTAG